MLSPIKFQAYEVQLIDQRYLPNREIWVSCVTSSHVAEAISSMVVRGAPAIGCAAAFGVALAIREVSQATDEHEDSWNLIEKKCRALKRSRPTAVNLAQAVDWLLEKLINDKKRPVDQAVVDRSWELAEQYFQDDVNSCLAIGEHGANHFHQPEALNVLTHCNAGALATAGYGTALGVIRSLWEMGKLSQVYVDETRPYLQGTRLTAFELAQDLIPHHLLCDNAASFLMAQGKVDLVVTGADRITANGDVANKVGTLSLAINARYFNIPFYIAAPRTTFDMHLKTGDDIPIEIRSADEVLKVGEQLLGSADTKVYNPSFDVTPAELISGYITDVGVLAPPFSEFL